MTPAATVEPQVVERGDHARPYRARKPPEARHATLCGIGPAVLVLRCHDLDVAAAVALDADLIEPAALVVRETTPVWVRYIPDDYADPSAGGVWERELRGTAGATPAVLFTTQPLPQE